MGDDEHKPYIWVPEGLLNFCLFRPHLFIESVEMRINDVTEPLNELVYVASGWRARTVSLDYSRG